MAERPVPTPHADSAPYWEGCAAGELRLQFCLSCKAPRFYPRTRCPHCFSDDVEWRPTSGRGHIYSFIVAHRAFHPYFAERVPYVVALIDLEEGPRMMSNVVADPAEVMVGAPVTVCFEQFGDINLPLFRLSSKEE